VAQVVAQALASLEGQVKGTVTDYVVKVCIFEIEIESSEKEGNEKLTEYHSDLDIL